MTEFHATVFTYGNEQFAKMLYDVLDASCDQVVVGAADDGTDQVVIGMVVESDSTVAATRAVFAAIDSAVRAVAPAAHVDELVERCVTFAGVAVQPLDKETDG